MTIIVEKIAEDKMTDAVKLAEAEAEDFYGAIELEEEIRYRLESLYEVCKKIIRRLYSTEAVRQTAVDSGAFTDEEIILIENAYKLHMDEDGDHYRKMRVIHWINNVARAKKAGYNNDGYETVVEDLFKSIQFK